MRITNLSPTMFQYESSQVSWCEPNYQFFSWVTELFNTLSSLHYILVGSIQLYMYNKYIRNFDTRSIFVAGMMIFIGMGSTYFHATLSTAGQLADELGILWLMALCMAWYFPMQLFPDNMDYDAASRVLTRVSIVVAVISTIICRVYPQANAYTLLVLGQPFLMSYIWAQFKTKSCLLKTQLFKPAFFFNIIALTCWLVDTLACDATKAIGFPYLHAIWHILSAYGCGHILNLVIFYKLCRTSDDYTKLKFKQHYYPSAFGLCGVPYLTVESFE